MEAKSEITMGYFKRVKIHNQELLIQGITFEFLSREGACKQLINNKIVNETLVYRKTEGGTSNQLLVPPH